MLQKNMFVSFVMILREFVYGPKVRLGGEIVS